MSELGRVTSSQLLLDQPRRHRAGHTQAGLAGPRAGAELLLTGVGVLAGGFPVVGVAGRVSVPVVFVPLRLPGSCWVARERLGWACMGRIVARLVALGRVGLLGGGVGSSAGGSTWRVPLAVPPGTTPTPPSSPGLVVVVASSTTTTAGRLDVRLEKLRVGGGQHWIDEVCEVGTSRTSHVVAGHGRLQEAAWEVL